MIFELTPPLLNKQKRTLSREHGFIVQFIVMLVDDDAKGLLHPIPIISLGLPVCPLSCPTLSPAIKDTAVV